MKKIINYILIRFSFFLSILLRKYWHKGSPVSLSLEPTTSCNLHCPECPSGLRQFSRPQGGMPIDKFREIIDETRDKLAYLMLYFQGEPFLNPAFFDMVSYATAKRIYTATSTNGHFLNDENARKIVRSGLNRLIISVDGIDQETYERYRKGGNLDKVMQGIKDLVRVKNELRSSKPFTILQFLVNKSNEHQIKEIKKLACQLHVDRLELKSLQVYNYRNDTELIPDNTKYARYVKLPDRQWKLKKSLKNRCFRMWSGSVITWDGRVVPCCFDKDADHQLGIISKSSFKEIWNSKAYLDFRQKILKNRAQVKICMNCTE